MSSFFPTAARSMLSRRTLLGAGLGLGAWHGLGNMITSLVHGANSIPGRKPIKSCIVLFYYGGPSHIDTVDMKPNAPKEVRGNYQPIATNAPGIQVCEHLPLCARIMDKVSIIRSMHHPMTNHNAAVVEALCGRTPVKGDLELLANDPMVDFPCYGSAADFLLPRHKTIPTHIALPHVMYNVVVLPGQYAGFLGVAHNPLQLTRDPNSPNFQVDELALPVDTPQKRLLVRENLLTTLEGSKQAGKASAGDSMRTYQQRAFRMLQSEEMRVAWEIGQEKPETRERYGRHTLGQSLLLARRLVEAGVRFINVNDKIHNGQDANWDSHSSVYPRMTDHLLPPSDQAYSALIEDLHERGLLETTLVVGMGEFGRTPKINASAGRDHWPNCYSVWLAGGGITGGQTYGTSDKIGAYPDTSPVKPGDLAATIFWRFGIDPHTLLKDGLGRPHALAEGEPLTTLFG
ncbi:MAG: DUF1501 domain-containing protein [Planctomycetales bacterium]